MIAALGSAKALTLRLRTSCEVTVFVAVAYEVYTVSELRRDITTLVASCVSVVWE